MSKVRELLSRVAGGLRGFAQELEAAPAPADEGERPERAGGEKAMPYTIVKKGEKKYCVYKKEDGQASGDTLGCHETKEDAEKQVAAIWANEERGFGALEVTADLMEEICPGCAAKMREQHVGKVTLRDMPAQMLQGLCDSLGADPGLFGRCKDKDFGGFEKFIKEKEGFCAWLHKQCTGEYPGKREGLEIEYVDETAERALSMQDIFGQVVTQLDQQAGGPEGEPAAYPFLHDLYFDNGLPVAIYSAGGKMYRTPILVDGGTVTLGVAQEIEVQFAPVQGRGLQVFRQADGRHRWFTIACSAVLNRVGEIDSKALFDSFVANAPEHGMPTLRFYHDPRLDFGRADYLARDGELYLATGLLDAEHPLAVALVDACEKGRGRWGCSISYKPTADRQMLEAAPGVTIPVYAAGINTDISVLPEDRAASWGTAINAAEVMRMRKEVLEALEVLIDDKDRLAEFVAGVDGANQEIAERGLVTRSDAPAADAQPPAPTAEPPAAEPGPQPEPAPAPAPAPQIVVLDDAAVAAVAERVRAVLPAPPAAADLGPMQAAVAKVEQAVGALGERLAALERPGQQAQQERQDDMPAGPPLVVTYRPREQRAAPADGAPPNSDEQAAPTLAKLHAKRKLAGPAP